MKNNSIKYWCETCNNIVHWTAEDFATKGEPVCIICDTDMEVVIEE
jgi:hypothetical protein